MAVRDFKDLLAWQQAMSLCKHIYGLAAKLPADERFGLCSQMRRSAVSVPSNIAEGHGRRSRGEYLQFIGHARGSLGELETQVLLCREIGMVTIEEATPVLNHVQELKRILDGLRNALAPSSPKRDPVNPDTHPTTLTPNP